MHRCWNCGIEHECSDKISYSRELQAEYDRGYNDARKLFTKPVVYCDYDVEWKSGEDI